MTSDDARKSLELAIADAAKLTRAAKTASLATLDRASGHPYVSLVTLALDVTGAPLLLISKLARHTQNLMSDGRASLLVTPLVSEGDPLALARLTLMGTLQPTASPTAKACFLARHPDAAVYANFDDFAFYCLTVANAHFIGGFGRIIDLSGPRLTSVLAASTS